ncbi:MAG TPA: endonuclease/exonuclease/phosphatase family protein [Myxococcales bacterium]|jgi:endonuclease/exonuclease/phosphatase family metal-dependent hydrolase
MRRSLFVVPLILLCSCPPQPPSGPADAAPDAQVDPGDACLPLSCGAFNCGSLEDGCGTSLNCGTCTLPETCGGAGADHVCGIPPCEPESDGELCLAQGRNCGPLAARDRCGADRTAQCGDCTAPQTCGGSGAQGVCGDGTCSETDAELCKRFGKDCDAIQARDLCNQPRTVECGTCTAPDTCGYGGAQNVCGRCPTPETDAELCTRLNTFCGSITATDLCGDLRTVLCGECPDACVVGCPDGCTPETAQQMCGRLAKNCGTLTETDAHCGNPRTVYCGFCGAPNACGADNVCACTPKTCADLGRTCGKVPDDCGGELDCGPCSGSTPPYCIKIAAANLTSGNLQSYDPGEGIRIFQGLEPDVVMIQEFNYAWNNESDIRAMITTAFGANFWHWREPAEQIPNGVISRFPIIAAGEWQDTETPNRDFVWAHIDVPGPKDLWVVSLHLMTSTAGTRAAEANAIVANVKANIPAGDFLVIGGDLNTGSRTETSISTLKQVVVTGSPWPADQKGNGNTNASRGDPLDWVMANSGLDALEAPLKIGSNTFTNGLVFDSRVYTPLADVAPVQKTDSGATFMQHMMVIREFCLPL